MAVALGTVAAWASATSPTLVLSAGQAVQAEGRYTVTIEGTFDFANAVQVGYPLQIVLFQGTRFVRFPLGGTPLTGVAAVLADGRLNASELPALLAAGSPASSEVRLLALTAKTAVLAIPAEFARGAATVQTVALLAEHPVLSNPLALVLP